MQINDAQKETASKFFSDFWKLVKTYFNPDPNTDSPYWHDLINDAGELGKKYGAKPGSLYANLINAFLDTCNGEAYRAKSKGEREI